MSSPARYLVTGAMGCIGAWTVRSLVRAGKPVVAFDRASDPARLRAIMSADELAQVEYATGDITDLATVEALVVGRGTTHLVHLAALQVPFCKADPPLGAAVNVVGTVNVFEAAKRSGGEVRGIVYMSSIGMYDAADAGPGEVLGEHATAHPTTHYGVYKLANEGTASIYWNDDGVASVGLRPFIVYGVGRDQGLTSSPTLAMRAAALGEGFRIPFGGRAVYQLAEEVGDTVVAVVDAVRDGTQTFNLGGRNMDMAGVVRAIEAVVPEVVGRITFADTQLPFPGDVSHSELSGLVGDTFSTTFEEGTRRTIEHFRRLEAGLRR